MSRLDEIKSEITFHDVNEETNNRCKAWIQRETDCFGHRYDPADREECGTCIVMAEVDGRKEPTWVFCKELCEQEVPATPSPELKEAIEEVQTKIKDKKEKPDDPIWKAKMVTLIGTMENKDLVDAISQEFNVDNRKVRLTLAGVLSSQKRKGAEPSPVATENQTKEVVEKMADEKKESKTAVVRRLLTEGKTDDEVAQAMVPIFIADGKPEDWAQKRAKGIVKLFIKEYGDPRIPEAPPA